MTKLAIARATALLRQFKLTGQATRSDQGIQSLGLSVLSDGWDKHAPNFLFVWLKKGMAKALLRQLLYYLMNKYCSLC